MRNTATKVGGSSGRPGLYMCNACRSQFTVTVGTLMERSKIPLHKWLCATYLLMSSKDGLSTHRLHDMLDVSLKSTWFLMHRIREALNEGGSPFALEAGRGAPIRARPPGRRGAGGKHRPVHH
jgi:transposase-like protein